MEIAGFLSVKLKSGTKYFCLKIDGGPEVIHIHDVMYQGLVYPTIPLHPKLFINDWNTIHEHYGNSIYMALVSSRKEYKKKGNDLVIKTEDWHSVTICENESIPEWANTSEEEAQRIVDDKQATLNAKWNKEKEIKDTVEKVMNLIEYRKKSSLWNRLKYSKARIERLRQFFTIECTEKIRKFEEAKDKKAIEKNLPTIYMQ